MALCMGLFFGDGVYAAFAFWGFGCFSLANLDVWKLQGQTALGRWEHRVTNGTLDEVARGSA